ncbi:MAG: type IV pili methyl-accepting chemotaxis transducer N-terminal domain-containing protein [Pseudomonadota bacterium]
MAAATAVAFLYGAAQASGVAVAPGKALEAETRIALAEREATMVEDIVKATCMLHLGVDATRHGAMIDRDAKTFDAVLYALQFGGEDYGLTREVHSKVIDAVRELKIDWLPFRERAEAALGAGVPTAEQVLWLSENDAVVLEHIEALVTELQKVYGGKAVPLHLAVATKLAQRQATIVQRIAKETCMISAGLKADEMRDMQPEMLSIFENTLSALRDGMPMLGIQKPTTQQVVDQWAVVQTHWQALRETLAPVEAGGTLDTEELAEMSRRTTALTIAIDTVVSLYADEI